MGLISRSKVDRFEIRLERQTFGAKEWHKWYYFPRVGLTFNYLNLNNESYFGKAYSFAASMSFDLYRKNDFSLQLTTDAGVGYIEKSFDAENNYKNVAIGSQGNIYIAVQADLLYDFGRNYTAGVGLAISHFSNTAFQMPNLGINVPGIQFTLKRHIGSLDSKLKQNLDPIEKKSAFWKIRYGGGFNETFPVEGPKYFASFLSAGRYWRPNFRSTIGVNLDNFYNPAQIASLEGIKNVSPGWENLQTGISFMHELNFGRFGFITQFGYYLKTEQEQWGNNYQIVGGSIEVNKTIEGFFALKTHRSTAEYFMIGIEVNLKNE